MRMTQIFGDIATATRIESIAKTMSVSSTLTTVAQNARQAQPGRRRLDGPPLLARPPLRRSGWYGRYSRYSPPMSFTQPSRIR